MASPASKKYSAVPPPPGPDAPGPAARARHGRTEALDTRADAPAGQPVDDGVASALQALSLSPSAARSGAPLGIPLDDGPPLRQTAASKPNRGVRLQSLTAPDALWSDGQRQARKTSDGRDDGDVDEDKAAQPDTGLHRRDSLRRREALLKGKEGSRRRIRWENDRLLHVPNVQPPLPSDWLVGPTHPVRHVPYAIACLWDTGLRERAEARAVAAAAAAARRRMEEHRQRLVLAAFCRRHSPSQSLSGSSAGPHSPHSRRSSWVLVSPVA